MKAAIFFIALYLLPEGVKFDRFAPDCGGSHCQVTIEQAQGVEAFQMGALQTIKELNAEVHRMRQACATRGGNT